MNHRIFDPLAVKGRLLSYEEFRKTPRPFLDEVREDLIAKGEKALSRPIPNCPITGYLDYTRDGDRSRYEEVYFERRVNLLALTLAEGCERKGRFTDAIANLLWAIAEETTWVLPAHIHGDEAQLDASPYDGTIPLPKYYRREITHWIDLFSAETGALFALCDYLLEKELDALSLQLRDRIRCELDLRIITPYRTRNDMWWQGESGERRVNNWNPWILSNILTVVVFTAESLPLREQITSKILRQLNHFTEGYHEDGGCDEGPSYWTEAGAALFDACELVYDASGGRLNVFSDGLLKNIGEYIAKAHISDSYYLNFADSPPVLTMNGRSIARYGAECASPVMQAFGKSLVRANNEIVLNKAANAYRTLCDCTMPCVGDDTYAPFSRVWLEGLQVMALRDSGIYFAMKGGHNAESHNHNDVGSFVVYADGRPLLVDMGSDRYTAATFDPARRYSLWQNRSLYHNLPDFDGIEQHAGRDYRAVQVEESPHALSLELKEAYPENAGILSYKRKGSLEDGTVTIEDMITLARAERICFRFITVEPPHVEEGVIRVGAHTLSYPDSLKASVEELPLSSIMQERWSSPVAYRLTLESAPVTECNATFRIQ